MSSQRTVQTVTGPIPVEALGRTLMHEHLSLGVPGWELDKLEPGPTFRDLVARCVDSIAELKSAGFASLVDPCPSDMGRDVELMREVARRTGFNIICATGFYHSELGASTYWKVRLAFDRDARKRIADILIKDLTEGIGDTGIKAGILKTATGKAITPYEMAMMAATAQAALTTGAPVTTHTEGVLGDVQLDTMTRVGLSAKRIIVGHCCGSNDFHYHRSLLDRGAYLGFDRFGMEDVNLDARRVESLAKLVQSGFGDRIVVSHDCVLCYRGMETLRPLREHGMMRFSRLIVPTLRERGLGEADIDRLIIDNPRCFFSGATPASTPF